jgi:hypothetical protein
MDVEINEVVTTVHAVDSGALLSPQLVRRLIEQVTRAMSERLEHEKRAGNERRVTGGVSVERDEESE